MATSFMSSWAPLWRMSASEAIPYGARSVQSLLEKANIHPPEAAKEWWLSTFTTTFSDHFFRLALFSFAFQILLGFLPHLFGAEKHYFSMGPLNIIIGCLYTWFTLPHWGIRHFIVNTCAIIWAARLGRFLVDRANTFGNGRKMKAVQSRPLLKLTFWLGQWAWVMVCLAPIIALNSTPATQTYFNRAYWGALPSLFSSLKSGQWQNFARWGRFIWRTLWSNTPGRFSLSSLNWRDFVGIAMLWIPGFVLEVAADRQKSAFRASTNKHAPFPHHGLWGLVRHPNYLGELMMWTGLTLSASNGFTGLGRLAILTPVFVFFILAKVSGIPLQEHSMKKQLNAIENYSSENNGSGQAGQISFKNMYQRYLDSTKALIPFLF